LRLLTGNFENSGRGFEVFVSTESAAARARVRESCVSKLANFFPDATPSRIAVRVERIGPAEPFSENTVIEYGTNREALFACTHPLEFADRVHLRNSDGSLDVEASVVAVQYHNDQTAVAARFSCDVANWIVKS
jgi:hypothetical protein